jgi:hypothetical protein
VGDGDCDRLRERPGLPGEAADGLENEFQHVNEIWADLQSAENCMANAGR